MNGSPHNLFKYPLRVKIAVRINTGNKRYAMLFVLAIMVVAIIAVVGCDSTEPTDVIKVPTTSASDSTEAQVHVAESGGYTLRANVIQSDFLSSDMRAQYGIEDGANRNVLNLVIMKKEADGKEITVSADVTARQQNLVGQFDDIDMKAITANENISYIGVFESSSQQNFRFEVTAQPGDSDSKLMIEFEERFPVFE